MSGGAAAELIDVVDDGDRVVGQATRGEMRARGLRHRATYVLVFNGRGEVFVHQRTATKDVYPSYWDVAVGGVVAAGESYERGAERELAEEVGVRGVPLEPLFDFAYDDAATHVQGRAFRAVWDGPLRLQVEEIAQGEWLAPDAVEARMATQPFCPDGAAVWRRYRGAAAHIVRSVS